MRKSIAGILVVGESGEGENLIHRRVAMTKTGDGQKTADRLAGYERLSGIVWVIIAAFQILSVVLIVAGIWNLFAVRGYFQRADLIRRRHPLVPSLYESVTPFVISGAVNLLLGGVIGVFVVLFGSWIRGQVLLHREIFSGE